MLARMDFATGLRHEDWENSDPRVLEAIRVNLFRCLAEDAALKEDWAPCFSVSEGEDGKAVAKVEVAILPVAEYRKLCRRKLSLWERLRMRLQR